MSAAGADDLLATTWDVVVVGAGSAGAPLAAGLSEDPARRVLLLEAGPDWRAADAPAALRSSNIVPFMHDPAHQAAWQWPGLMARRTRAQRPQFYWRGRAMGGSSVVNAQIAIRGVADAFDDWAERGCEGWSADEFWPAFRAIEDDPVAGHPGGPLPVFRAPEAAWGPVDRALRDAALALGYPRHDDLNARDGEGVATYPINTRDGQRVTAHDAFLEPARARPNLCIQGGATVDRVLFDGLHARGLRIRLDGGPWIELAAREVVLCAGAVGSPAILQRSGLGDASALRALGIAVLRDMPQVGAGLMDHPILRATLPLRPAHAPADPEQRHTNCCVTYSSGLGGGGRRDMILIAFNHRGLPPEGPGGAPNPVGAVGAALYDAFSRGTVALGSADPDAPPVIEENMLDDPRDRLRMRDAVRRLAALCAQPALLAVTDGARFGDTGLAPAEAAALPDDELDALMLAQAGDIQHAAGTCRMSAHEDPRGVVDPDLRVRGVGGLRVADASIMPSDCRANLHFTCVAIGALLARRMR